MATRAKNISFASGLIQNDFTEMFLLSPFTKIAKMVLLCWTKWSPELKVEKLLNNISVASGWISK